MKVKKRKIAVICSSRATYGYKKNILQLLQKSKKLELCVIVTGMHLLKEYGLTVREIERDKIPIHARVDMVLGGDTGTAWTKSIGVEIQGLAQVYDMLKPDLVLVTGDRAEMFGATITAAYMNIPIAHIQAGDVSGHIDGNARHAITKLANIHFPSCEDSAKRVVRLGEEKWRIYNVGAPQLDNIIHGKKLSKSQLEKKLGYALGSKTALVIQHAVLVEKDKAYWQMKQTMEALEKSGLTAIILYPNVDAAGMEVIRAAKEYEGQPNIHSHQNFEREVFISLLNEVDILVGNSSCGILEAPSFKLPVVNIGNRQRGRMQAPNILNCGYDSKEILKTIKFGLTNKGYKEKLKKCKNPYGDGKSSKRIVQILENLNWDEKLLDKKITY